MQASENGLDEAEVKRRIEQYGYNKLPESTRIPFLVCYLVAPHTQLAQFACTTMSPCAGSDSIICFVASGAQLMCLTLAAC